VEKLTPRQRELIETRDLCISEFVRLELQYLYEIERIGIPPQRIIAHLAAHAEVTLSTCPIHAIIDEAVNVRWTRDPFDRLIVANAQAEKVQLITLDATILKHCRLAVC